MIRPRDLAVLLLASGDVVPRRRARDQQADRAGLELRRRLLERLAALDPEPEALDAALRDAVEALGPPSGPTRAIASGFRDDFDAACQAPDWVAHLIGEAARRNGAQA